MTALPDRHPADDDTTLEIRRLFAASTTALFDAWMVREQWAAWLGPEGMSCKVPFQDPTVGGRYEISMHLSTGQIIPVSGTYRVIDRPHRLVFSWGWDGDPARQSLITLEFIARGASTELVLRQEGLASAASRDDHGKGWTSALNKLERCVTR